MLLALSVLFGLLVGFALGLTGGGGAIFAVPLLVYGLAVEPREAVGVSLASVGATSLAGLLHRLRAGEVELGTGLLFAGGGMLGAPLGSWLGGILPASLLLTLFAGLMLIVAVRMWRVSSKVPPKIDASATAGGGLALSPHGVARLALAGTLTGALSGLFGVGGGFVIVPALVLVSGMAIHRAVATSLLAITLISASAVATHLAAHRPITLEVTALFIVGGILGMGVGTALGRRLSGRLLQRVFAVAILAVAAFVIIKTLA